MALSDEVMDRYRSRKGGGGASEAKDDDAKEKGAHTAGKALLAAVRRGDAEAVEEAIRACVDGEY